MKERKRRKYQRAQERYWRRRSERDDWRTRLGLWLIGPMLDEIEGDVEELREEINAPDFDAPEYATASDLTDLESRVDDLEGEG